MIRILIVDDNYQNRYLLESILKGQGYDVISAVNGKDALTLAKENLPNLVISDILMPTMDGYELCRKWKNDEQLKQIPFVFYTATYTEPKDEEFALSLGADRFLLKPQKPEVLDQIVREILEALLHDTFIPATPYKKKNEEMLQEYNEILFHKLEKKIHELEIEISSRTQAEAIIVNLLEEKNVLLMELHDRVKNNLQIMISIMRMELDSVCNEECRAVIQRLRDRIWSMALVHREIYNEENLSCISFQSYVAKVIADLSDSYLCPPSILEFKNNIGDHSFSIKTAIPCTMIVQEVLSLVFGHNRAVRKGGIITLNLELQQNRYCLSIVDDGKGLTYPYEDTIVTNISRLLLKHAANQLNGDLQISFEKGFSVAVFFSKDDS
jgi:two-component sensor histidine kinase